MTRPQVGGFCRLESSLRERQRPGSPVFQCRENVTYSITGHKGERSITMSEAAELNQPQIPFTAPKHEGRGKSVSFVSVSDSNTVIRCIKKEEKGDRIIVRVQETSGKGVENCRLSFAADLISAVETNGYEEELGAVEYSANELTFALTPYAVKTFAVILAKPYEAAAVKSEPAALPYNKKVTTSNTDRTAGEFADGISIPAELYKEHVVSGGTAFTLAPASENNAVVSRGQVIELPEGYDTLYLLAASANGDKKAVFLVDGKPVTVDIQDYKENVGVWSILINGDSSYMKRDEIAVNYTHTHDADGDRLYLFAYLFKYALDVAGAKTVTFPDDEDIIVMAATVSERGNAAAYPLAPLYDRVETPDAPKYKLTAENAEGSGMYPEGKLVVVRAKQYENKRILVGWNGDCIISTHNAGALIRMPAHDLTVKAVIDQMENDSVLRGKPCKVSSMIYESEIGSYALDGNENTKWCTRDDSGIYWLEADAEEVVRVGKWFVMHAGLNEAMAWNTRSFRLEYKVNESDEWQVADALTDNQDSLTYRTFEPVEGRYFRLYIDQASQDPDDKTMRIFMFEVYKV